MFKYFIFGVLGLLFGLVSASVYFINAYAYRELEAVNKGYIKIGSCVYALTKKEQEEQQ